MPTDENGQPICGFENFELARKPAELLLVLDRSVTMGEPPSGGVGTKWDLVVPQILSAMSTTQSVISWGLSVFPVGQGEQCTPSTLDIQIDVPVALNNAAAVQQVISGLVPEGNGTPTGYAITLGAEYLAGLQTGNPKYMILATDGEPSCPGDGSQDVARPHAFEAISAAANAGYHVFVVGIWSDSNDSSRPTLTEMAVRGLEPRDQPNPLADRFYRAGNDAELTEALTAITSAVATCRFDLTKAPPEADKIASRYSAKTPSATRPTPTAGTTRARTCWASRSSVPGAAAYRARRAIASRSSSAAGTSRRPGNWRRDTCPFRSGHIANRWLECRTGRAGGPGITQSRHGACPRWASSCTLGDG